MGQCVKSQQIQINQKKTTDSKIIKPFQCFKHSSLILNEIHQFQSKIIPTNNFVGNGCNQMLQKMLVKKFIDQSKTKTSWLEEKIWQFPFIMKKKTTEEMMERPFQEKLYWLRENLETFRVPWQQGCQTIKVDRMNLLMTSKVSLQKINLYKQLKIIFNDEVVDDAGGLLRQWMHLTIKEIFSKQTGLFQLAVTNETAYRFKSNTQQISQYVSEMMAILGLIIGKAIFQRISLNCFFDRTIIRQICNQPVHLCDIYSYDSQLYQSWKSILEMSDSHNLGLDFCVYLNSQQRQGGMSIIQMVQNAPLTIVTDTNKEQYIKLLIYHYTIKRYEQYMKILRSKIYSIIPFKLLQIFQPIEIQMLLYGPMKINVEDWRNNTDYKEFSPTDQVIQWFWDIVSKLKQQQLRNLLHYVTGSSRVPIRGFRFLESNRSQIARFLISKAPYNQDNPYPKSYTCFNRLQMPAYTTFSETKKCLMIVISSENSHFGLG